MRIVKVIKIPRSGVFMKDAGRTLGHFYTGHPLLSKDVKQRGMDLLNPVYNILDLDAARPRRLVGLARLRRHRAVSAQLNSRQSKSTRFVGAFLGIWYRLPENATGQSRIWSFAVNK
jgi:hypothetical protein